MWRGYIQRKRVKVARDEEMVFLGMVSKKWPPDLLIFSNRKIKPQLFHSMMF